jgi:integrase
MARITKPLTNTEIKQSKPKALEYSLVDGEGLKLRIKPNGSKLWMFNYYRPYSRKRTNMGLGVYPEVSLADARQKRKAARELLAKDIDPQEHRKQEKIQSCEANTNTLKLVATEWFEVKRSKVTPNYADDIWRSLELHIFPNLGELPIHKITAPKTIAAIKPIAAKGSLETVKRLSQRINEIMVYAVNTGLLDANPLAGIGKAFQSPEKKNFPTLKPEQLPELMKSLSTASIKLVTRCLIEWQLHTMTRPSEASGTRWDEIDIKSNQWNVPAKRMKKGRDHTIPLSDQAIALLEAVRPISGLTEFVFPSDRDYTKHTNSQTANAALKRMGYGNVLVAHGLRALASTTLNEQGFDPDVVEAALAHVDGNEVRRAYNRAEYLERRRTMMKWWSEYIENASTGNLSVANNYKHIKLVEQHG